MKKIRSGKRMAAVRMVFALLIILAAAYDNK